MYPVEELFLEDILEKTDYVVDEYSRNSRKLNKTMSRQIEDIDHDLVLGDSFTKGSIPRPGSADETLTIEQLFYRYKGSFSNATNALIEIPVIIFDGIPRLHL